MMRTVLGLIVVAVCVVIAFAVLRLVQSHQAAAAQDAKLASFVPDPNNETSLSIRGWTRPEVEQILADFLQLYGLPDSLLRLNASSDGSFVVTFPADIQPMHFFFLVNYVQYPKGFDLTNRAIGVVGRATLTPAFGVPNSTLVGKRAVIYVPANDTEYDLVHAQVETGKAYRIPFTNLIWEETADARMPAGISGL